MRKLLVIIFLFPCLLFGQINLTINLTITNSKTGLGVKSFLLSIKDLNGTAEQSFVIGTNGSAQITFTNQPSQYLVSVKATGYFMHTLLFDLEAIPLREKLDLFLKINFEAIGDAKPGTMKGDIKYEADYLYEMPKVRYKYFSKDKSIREDSIYLKSLSKTNEMVGIAMNSKYKIAIEQIKIAKHLNDIKIKNLEIEQRNNDLKSKQYELEKTNLKFESSLLEKKLKDKEISEKIKEIKSEKKEKTYLYLIIVAVACITLISIYAFLRQRKLKKLLNIKKIEAENTSKLTISQKHIIEEKHKEITDSINYAVRIQRSFIATKEILNENLQDYFVLFKPKDIVSGDFYWAAKLSSPVGGGAEGGGGLFALVTADSTGHGVPGAIMSLLNITSLEKAIETLTEPSEILNSTRKTIIERLKKDGSEHGGKDGMDVSLCVYDFKNKKLIVAAANNPVWIVRNVTSSLPTGEAGSDEGAYREVNTENSSRYVSQGGSGTTRTDKVEVIEIKADKMPVGKHDRDTVSFTQQTIDLQSGDVVYTLTDGFPDQFGGEKGKKFMSKNLRELLAANSHLPMQEQKQLLEKTFADWVGDLEQVDDVTLIGVRV